jgi:formimidoylglutamate deiminase
MPLDAPTTARLLWAPRAWLSEGAGAGWREQVLLRIGADGCWADIRAGVATPPPGAQVLAGPLLPGLVNAHSHAFQRAFAGLSERREQASDDFWSWRERMYGVALRITPEQLRAVAAQLYVELLRGGYTQVCEFHYLQHAHDGQAYADPAWLAWALADAAADAGIGLTLLPVLYERAGFAQPALRTEQRRFATTPASVLALHRAVRAARRPRVDAGLAIHSLRAASAASIAGLLRHLGDADLPIHIHVAEQSAEVDECLHATGARPIEWLLREGWLDRRWHLVHATHATPAEIDAVARCGAAIVVCPSTEANLGDGVIDLPRWLDAGVRIGIGSDSHATRAWVDELRALEYSQRLHLRRRNVAAAPERGVMSSAERLFAATQAGSGGAAGLPSWGLLRGARADALLLDARDSAMLGVPPAQTLDALVFSSPSPLWRGVMVAGNWVVAEGVHAGAATIASRFEAAMHELWAATP